MKNDILSYQVGQKIALVSHPRNLGSFNATSLEVFTIVKISKRPRVISLQSEKRESVLECKYAGDSIDSPRRFSYFDDITEELLARVASEELLAEKVRKAESIRSALLSVPTLEKISVEELEAFLKLLEAAKENG